MTLNGIYASLDKAAERTQRLPFRIWGFGEGPALLGLLAGCDLLGKRGLEQSVADLLEPALRSSLDLEDHVASTETLLSLYRRRGDRRYAEVAERWAQLVLNASRLEEEVPPVFRPDLFRLSHTIWVDSMYTLGPGLAVCGYLGEAAQILEQYSRCLQAPSGLYYHGYDVLEEQSNEVAWGRGCGWALLGLAGTVGRTQNERLRNRLAKLVAAFATYEDDGKWHTVIDDPSTPIENSVSAFVASGLLLAIDQGAITPGFHGLAVRAVSAALDALIDGGLPVSEATPVGDRRTYVSRRTGVFPWGQGPLLLALASLAGWTEEGGLL